MEMVYRLKSRFFMKKTTKEGLNCALAGPIDAGYRGAKWGILRQREYEDLSGKDDMSHTGCVALVCTMDASPEEAEQYMRYFSENSAESWLDFFDNGKSVVSDRPDVLLYSQKGQFLWILLMEKPGCRLPDLILIDKQGDEFMSSFPEVYHDYGSFFHRYMTVLSDLYREQKDRLEKMSSYFDIESADEKVLSMLAEWLGITVDRGLMDTQMYRAFVAEGFLLNKRRGTKWCLKRIIKIVTDCEGSIIERNRISQAETDDSMTDRLYGSFAGDITVLLPAGVSQERIRLLQVILPQFAPVSCRIYVATDGGEALLDGYGALDMGARSMDTGTARTGDGACMDSQRIMS